MNEFTMERLLEIREWLTFLDGTVPRVVIDGVNYIDYSVPYRAKNKEKCQNREGIAFDAPQS